MTTIISNVMLSPGVKITATTLRPVLCRPLSTTNVRTENLITKVVKKTGREHVVRVVMSTPVLRDGFMLRQTVVRGIILTVNVVPLLLLPVVRPIIRLPVTRHADLPERIPAVIPVTDVVMIPVRQGHQKTITDLMLLLPNVVQDVTDVKTVHPAAGLIPVLMSGLPSVEAAMHAPILVAQVRSPYLALPIM